MNQLDLAIKNANRLVELLREAKQIIDSLGFEHQKDVSIKLHITDTDADNVINKDIDSMHFDFAAILQKFNIV